MATTKSKLQMEYNKEVTLAAPGLVYVCFDSFVKCSSVWAIAWTKSNKSIIFLINFNYFICIYIFISSLNMLYSYIFKTETRVIFF